MGESTSTAIEDVFTMSLIGVMAMLLLAMAVIVFYLLYQRKLIKQQRQVQGLLVEQRRQVLEATLMSEERERGRIAAELHDGLGSLLSTGQLFIRQIPVRAGGEGHWRTSLDILDQSLAHIRTITRDLAPQNLLNFGIVAATEDLVRRYNDVAGLRVTFTVVGGCGRMAPDLEVNLYRIIQEVMTNCLKHAQATRADLTLRLTGPERRFEYEDDGVGMTLPNDSPVRGVGFGLGNIRTRAQVMGGEVTITSSPGQGFRLVVCFPELIANDYGHPTGSR